MPEYIFGGIIRKKLIDTKGDALCLIFSEYIRGLSDYGIRFADRYAEEIKSGKIIVITGSRHVRNEADRVLKTKKRLYLLRQKDMKALLLNLSYHVDLMGDSIYDSLYFVSDQYPAGVGQKLIRDAGVFDDDYIVWNRIYHKKAFYSADTPIL